MEMVLINKDNRKRGLVINFDNNNYILSLNDTVLEYDEEVVKEAITKLDEVLGTN